MKRITANHLEDCVSLGKDGRVLDPAATPFVLRQTHRCGGVRNRVCFG